MKLTLQKVTPRHIASINKDLYECGATDETSKIYEKITLWKSDWENANIIEGAILTGDVKETEKNGYKNFTFYPERTNTLKPNRSAGAITKAMDRKEAGIDKTMDRKEEGIKTSSTMRDAVLLTVATLAEGNLLHGATKAVIENEVLYWRNWLAKHWDDECEPFA